MFRANRHARSFQAALAQICDNNGIIRTLIACKLNYVDQRRFIVLFSDDRRIHAIADIIMNTHFTHRQSHCKAKAFAYYSSFMEHTAPVAACFVRIAGADLICKFFKSLSVISAFISKSCNFGKNSVSDFRLTGFHSSH